MRRLLALLLPVLLAGLPLDARAVSPTDDEDSDGLLSADEDPDADGDYEEHDTDADEVADYLDNDDDGDGVPTRQEDLDADGNYAEHDSDRDQVPDYLDPDPADRTAPTLTCPPDQVATSADATGTTVNYPPATATDAVDPAPALAYGTASGSLFPVGATTVTVTATDAAGNVATCRFEVTVTFAGEVDAGQVPDPDPTTTPSCGCAGAGGWSGLVTPGLVLLRVRRRRRTS